MPRDLPLMVLLAVVCGLMAWKLPSFRTPGNLAAVAEGAALLGIMACGEGLVILCGGLDLSVGSALALATCGTAAALTAGWAWPLAALVGLLCGGLAGAINGALITYRRLPPILTTLATLLLFRYGVSLLTNARSYGPFPDAFNQIGNGWTPAVLLVVVVLFFILLTRQMRFGRWVLALGGNEQAARLSGVPTDRVKRLAYLLSGLCAGLAGLITMAFNNNAQSRDGKGLELNVIAACVVGGIRITGGDGSLLGAALGALLITLLGNALILTSRPEDQHGLFTGLVIVVVALIEQWRLRRQERAAREGAVRPGEVRP
ncbi:MAG TPA: ABC transporter permease [Chthonomonadaceae bacterium]|nr:ABC transporter permease [Chthonomonadaceae bacterium]